MRTELGCALKAAPVLALRDGVPGQAPPPVPNFTVRPMVIEGDSITSTTPNQGTDHGAFYSYTYQDSHPSRSIVVAAQGSRTVGGANYNGDGEDLGTPAGNTLLLRRAEDIANLEPGSLLFVMIGANDLSTYATATYIQRLIDWAGPVRAAGIKIAYGVCTPRLEGYTDYDTFMPKWHALFDTHDIRDPAVWGQWADYYVPMGEHPIFVERGYVWTVDGVHPSAPVSAGGSGQYYLNRVFLAAMDTLHDTARINSTKIYDTIWPADPVDLPLSTVVELRIPLAGLAWTGTNVTVSVSGAGSPEIRRGGSEWGSADLDELMYNGDVIGVRATTSASYATSISFTVTINGEEHTFNYPTLALSEYTATFDPARRSSASYAVLSNGNRTFAGTDFGSPYYTRGAGTVALSDPTGYVEFTQARHAANGYRTHLVGLVNAAHDITAFAQLGWGAGSIGFHYQGIYYAGSGSANNLSGSSWDYDGVIGLLVHKASGKAWLRTSGGWFPDTPTFDTDGSLLGGTGIATGLTDFYFAAGQNDDSTLTVNAGQSAFTYAPPTNVTPGWK